MDLRLDFAAPTQHFAAFFLLFNMLVNKHSDFLALGFLTGFDIIGILGLLYMTPYGVDTIAVSIISFMICWSSHYLHVDAGCS